MQDISVFYSKCDSGCITCASSPSQCSSCNGTYYKSPTENKCIANCPVGYSEATGNTCVQFEFCHSTCESCSVMNNPSKCSTCPTSPILYETLSPPGYCQISTTDATKKWQSILTINKDTQIGTTNLKSIVYNNGVNISASGTLLSSFLYKENVIEFTELTSNTIKFQFGSLGVDHYEALVRINAYTECISGTENV